jgi:hypothetical protein
MLDKRWYANPAVCTQLLAFGLFHIERLFVFSLDDGMRLERLRHKGLELLHLSGAPARAAMPTAPFFNVGMSDGERWAPDR